MAKLTKIICHGCKRKVNALILEEHRKISHQDSDGQPVYVGSTRFKIKPHNRGWLKGRCNRSDKIFWDNEQYRKEHH